MWKINPEVRVRLIIGVDLETGFYGNNIPNMHLNSTYKLLKCMGHKGLGKGNLKQDEL